MFSSANFTLDVALLQLPFVILVQLSALFMVGAYSLIWRYVSIEDIRVFMKAAAISCVILVVFRFLLIFTRIQSMAGAGLCNIDRHGDGIRRTVGISDTPTLFLRTQRKESNISAAGGE